MTLEAPTSERALSGIRIIEIGRGMAAECAGLLLSSYGAEVIKIQRPESRADAHSGYRIWNSAKTVRDLDIADPAGAEELRSLIAESDVLVVAKRQSTRRKLAIEPDDVRPLNPGLVYCAIEGFGPGRYEELPGWEGLVSARTGRGSVYEGQVERAGPVFPAVPVGSYGAAHGAVQGILSALWQRELTGEGREVKTSLTRALATYDIYGWLELQFPDVVSQWVTHDEKSRRFRLAVLPFTVAATKDGAWLQFANNADHLFYRFMSCLGHEDIYLKEGYETLPNVTAETQLKVRRLIIETMRQKTLAEWEAIFDADGTLGYELIRRVDQIESHPQVAHNEQILRDQDGQIALAPPWKVAPAAPNGAPAARKKPSKRPGPRLLDGATVLELGGYLAGPFAGRLLAELGARVIKIEPPAGDPMRAMRGGLGPAHPNIGKESIALNLKKPFGRKALSRLIQSVDVLYHNYRPGIAESLGFSAEEALKLNPNLVYVYAASYGSSGPMIKRASYDVIPSSVAGCAARQSGGFLPPSAEETVRLDDDEVAETSRRLGLCTADVGDQSAAIQVTTAIIYGLLASRRTGAGCVLETTTLGAAIYANSEALDERVQADLDLGGEGLGLSPLYRLYQCRDGWVFLACLTSTAWKDLGEHVVPAVSQIGFKEAWGSRAVSTAIEEAFASLSASAVERDCLAVGVPCVTALPSRGALLREDWVVNGGLVAKTDDNLFGEYERFTGLLDYGPPPSDHGVPRLGEQTFTILSELGFTEGEIEAAQEDRAAVLDEPTKGETGDAEDPVS